MDQCQISPSLVDEYKLTISETVKNGILPKNLSLHNFYIFRVYVYKPGHESMMPLLSFSPINFLIHQNTIGKRSNSLFIFTDEHLIKHFIIKSSFQIFIVESNT